MTETFYLCGQSIAQSTKGPYAVIEVAKTAGGKTQKMNVWTPELVQGINPGTLISVTYEPSSNPKFRPIVSAVSTAAVPQAPVQAPVQTQPVAPQQNAANGGITANFYFGGYKIASSPKGPYAVVELKADPNGKAQNMTVWDANMVANIAAGSLVNVTYTPASNAKFRPIVNAITPLAATANTVVPVAPVQDEEEPPVEIPPSTVPAYSAPQETVPEPPAPELPAVEFKVTPNPGKQTFPPINVNQVEVRIAETRSNGVTLLVYKDARCDMQVLDLIFGTTGWQREYVTRGDKNFCIVKIWDDVKKQWIAKEDVGSPSNIEAEKGEASDSFKRACINVGFGRELYTCPEIRLWTQNAPLTIKAFTGSDGRTRYKCYDEFKVTNLKVVDNGIGYEIGAIDIALVSTNGLIPVFHWVKR